jgi:putative ABC transport system permease protein
VRLNGELFTVIGVMGRDFHFMRHSSLGPPEGAAAYITFPYELAARDPGAGAFAGLIRARAGATPAQVEAAVAAVGASIDARHFRKEGLKLYAVGLQDDLVAAIRPALVVLGLSASFLVLVLAANLATLLLARAVAREREFTVARALGAHSVALVRATLLEAATLGAIGGAGASLSAVWGVRALVALAPLDLPRRESIVMDWPIALAVIGVGVALGIGAATLPAVWASRASLAALLRNAAVRGGSGSGRLRRSLVVVQVTLCLILLSSGGVVARSFQHLLRSRPGFDPRGVLTLRVPIAPWRYPDNASAVAMHERIERALAAIPGVDAVGAGSALPLTAGANQQTIRLPGAPGNTGQREHDEAFVDVLQVRPGWFAALGTDLVSGRDVGPVRAGAHREALIDRTLAEAFHPTGSAVGTTVLLDRDTVAIVGVVDHARQYDLHRDGRPQLYLRDQDDTEGALYFALRTRRAPLDLAPEVRAVMQRLDPQLAIAGLRPLEQLVDDAVRQQRVSAALIAGFAIGALLLAAMGLFGVIAGSVAQRRNEIAVRLALGASAARVRRMLLREGGVLVALGFGCAVPGIFFAGRTLQATLIGISPFDPATLAVIALALSLVALFACYLPARRAGAIEPASVLRED